MMRKIATAASVTRIIEPAASAVPENQRSPGRCLALRSAARRRRLVMSSVLVSVVVSGVGPGPALSAGPGPDDVLDD